MVVLVGLVLSTLVVMAWFNRPFTYPSTDTWQTGRLLSDSYDPPDRPAELFQNQGDGQTFAHQAQDPFVQHPKGLSGGPEEQAYRLQRPLYGWVGWLASGGRPDAVALALIVVTVASVGLLGAAAALACRRLGAPPLLGLAVYAAPGVSVDLIRCGPEALGTALVAFGLAAWLRPQRRRWVAVACFAAAGMARESMLLVPLTLVAVECWTAGTDGRSGSWSWLAVVRRLKSPLLWSAAPFLAWLLVLRVGVHAWPRGSVDGRLSVVPFGGLLAVVGRWGVEEVVAVALLLGGAVAALAFGRDVRLKALVAAHLLLAATFGEAVWVEWLAFGRVLLPLSLVSLLSLAARWDRAAPPSSTSAVTAVQELDAP